MSDIRNERREYSRVELDLPVEVHQGGSVWHQRLIDISLAGASTGRPEVWDAQYNEPFTLVINPGSSDQLELHAYLQHVESGRLGFSVQHVDQENITPLRDLLGQHLDPELLEADLRHLTD